MPTPPHPDHTPGTPPSPSPVPPGADPSAPQPRASLEHGIGKYYVSSPAAYTSATSGINHAVGRDEHQHGCESAERHGIPRIPYIKWTRIYYIHTSSMVSRPEKAIRSKKNRGEEKNPEFSRNTHNKRARKITKCPLMVGNVPVLQSNGLLACTEKCYSCWGRNWRGSRSITGVEEPYKSKPAQLLPKSLSDARFHHRNVGNHAFQPASEVRMPLTVLCRQAFRLRTVCSARTTLISIPDISTASLLSCPSP